MPCCQLLLPLPSPSPLGYDAFVSARLDPLGSVWLLRERRLAVVGSLLVQTLILWLLLLCLVLVFPWLSFLAPALTVAQRLLNFLCTLAEGIFCFPLAFYRERESCRAIAMVMTTM
jgi:hypothetical protein